MPLVLSELEATYVEGSLWTPSDTNTIAIFSRSFQDCYDLRHDPEDGTHRDLRIARAYGVVTYAASTFTLAVEEGIASVTWNATGKGKVVLDSGLMEAGGSWQSFCWPNLVVSECLIMFESGQAGTTKDTTTCYVYAIDQTGTYKNCNFGFGAYGVAA